MKRFAELSEQEVLALAISNEDEDSRIYRGFAEGLRESFPSSAKVFDEMADEEVRHRAMLSSAATVVAWINPQWGPYDLRFPGRVRRLRSAGAGRPGQG